MDPRELSANISSVLAAFQDPGAADGCRTFKWFFSSLLFIDVNLFHLQKMERNNGLLHKHSNSLSTSTADRHRKQQQAAILTLVAAVFKLGAIIVLICNDNGDLADPDERFVGLIRGCDRQREFPLTLSVKADRCGDVTCRGHGNDYACGESVKLLSYS